MLRVVVHDQRRSRRAPPAMSASVARIASRVRYMTTPSQIQHVGDERSCPARSSATSSASRSKSTGTKVTIPAGGRQLGHACALVALRGGMIDLEDLHAGELGHAPGAPVVTGAEDDELRRAAGDRVAHRRVDRRGAQRHHVGHHARHLDAKAAPSLARGVLGLGEALLSLVGEEDARRRIVEVRHVRQPRVGHGAAECDEVSGAAGARGFHGSIARRFVGACASLVRPGASRARRATARCSRR